MGYWFVSFRECSFKEAAQSELRFDDVECELRPLQPRASPGLMSRVVVGNSTLRRLDAVSCALQVGNAAAA